MIQMTLYIVTLLTGLVFLQMIHPLAMGLVLMAQTLLVCLMTGLITKTFWFSYILFLIFMGGMLVLFIYVTSLASNEMFSLSTKMLLVTTTLFLSSMTYLSFTDTLLLNSFFQTNETQSLTSLDSLSGENTLMLSMLYNYPMNYMTIMLMIYLLVTLIAVVKITSVYYGPLRPMN